jgi:hypothetical protein
MVKKKLTCEKLPQKVKLVSSCVKFSPLNSLKLFLLNKEFVDRMIILGPNLRARKKKKKVQIGS